MKVNLLDLKTQYKGIEKEVLREIKKVCATQWLVLGKNVGEFEREIADYTGAKYAIGVASGSDALMVALMAHGVGPGDSVITTPYTFFSTAGSISILGARPVFVDIDPRTFNIDPVAYETTLKKLSKGRSKVKAVIPVHLYGQCADMGAIKKISRKYGVKVVEDAAQSIGAEYKGQGAGSMGDTGCFSFYPTKNLGGFGDGGMITTNSKFLDRKIRMLRVHGSERRYYHSLVGVNSRLDELQAVVLRIKLKHLDDWTGKRIKNAATYASLFEKNGLSDIVTEPFIESGNKSVFNQYIVRVKRRDVLRKYLADKGVGSEIYYPVPLHMQKCFKDLGYKKGSFPVSEQAAKESLALPIYPELKLKEIEYVVSSIAGFYSGK